MSSYEKELIQRTLDFAVQELEAIGYKIDTHVEFICLLREIKTHKVAAVISGNINDIEWDEDEKK